MANQEPEPGNFVQFSGGIEIAPADMETVLIERSASITKHIGGKLLKPLIIYAEEGQVVNMDRRAVRRPSAVNRFRYPEE